MLKVKIKLGESLREKYDSRDICSTGKNVGFFNTESNKIGFLQRNGEECSGEGEHPEESVPHNNSQ